MNTHPLQSSLLKRSIVLYLLLGGCVADLSAVETPTPEVDESKQPTGTLEEEGLMVNELPIVGGTDATIEQAPYQVSLRRRRGGHFCGGSIISSTWVITAAHCVEGGLQPGTTVVAGSSFRSRQGQVAQIVGGAIATGYRSPQFGKDFALLEVSPAFNLDGVRVASIPYLTPDRTALAAPGTTATVTGWGSLRERGPSPDQLQIVRVPVISMAQAQRVYGRLTQDQIAAGGSGPDSCQGDSGGPMVVAGPDGQPVLAGVVSWGNGCGRRGIPGMYARVSSFAEFIQSFTGVRSALDDVPAPAQAAPTAPPTQQPQPSLGEEQTATVTGSLAAGDATRYQPIQLEPGTLVTATISGRGDADLYLRFGAEPNAQQWDCRPFLEGSSESCQLRVPAANPQLFIAVDSPSASVFQLDLRFTGRQ